MDNAAILQRTDVGLETIKTKSIRLTQSERLILIIVDGVTPYSALRDKVWALSTERVTRAFKTLLEKNLIFEVLLREENQQPEELDSSLVDRFLEQDALDPVTIIISFDPEDDFGSDLIVEMGNAVLPQTSKPTATIQASPAARVSGALAQALPPVDAATAEVKSGPPPTPPFHLDPVETTAAVSPEPRNKPSCEIQAVSTTAHVPCVNPATLPPPHSDHSKVKSSLDRAPAGQATLSRKSPPRPLLPDGHEAVPKTAIKSASNIRSHDRHRTSRARASRTWTDDLLKLCCWTSVVSGIVIFMVLIFRYYDTVA
jgi:hypothetical protein